MATRAKTNKPYDEMTANSESNVATCADGMMKPTVMVMRV